MGEEGAHFEVYEGGDGGWFWRLRAGNGEIVAVGEGYVSKDGAVEGVRATSLALVEAIRLEKELMEASDFPGRSPGLEAVVEYALEDAEIQEVCRARREFAARRVSGGDTGLIGQQGPPGPRGEQGPKGDPGTPGGRALMAGIDVMIARRFHETYERLAPDHGYETREASAKPWEEVPEQNRGLMIAVVGELRRDGVVEPGFALRPSL